MTLPTTLPIFLLLNAIIQLIAFKIRKLFKIHIYDHIRKREYVKCPFVHICKCKSTFTELHVIRTHFFRNHPAISFEKNLNIVNIDKDHHDHVYRNINDTEDQESEDDDDHGNGTNNVSLAYSETNSNKLEDLGLKLLSHLYLTLESKFFVSKAALQTLITSLDDLNDLNVNFLKTKLAEFGIEVEEAQLQKDIFFKANNKNNGLLRSNVVREKFYKDNHNYVAPVKISLENDNMTSFFYYIPILESINMLLKNPKILEQCLLDHSSTNNDLLCDIVDGRSYRRNNFWKENKNALKLILYQDAFEVCNPLGSARKKHKILGIYMTLANFNPWQRSKVDQIQLVALCYEKDVNVFGFPQIFKTIIDDIKILETTGLSINKQINLKGSLLAVAGDNLGSHQIGGYLQNFSMNNYFCRVCYKNDGSFGDKEEFVYRTAQSYSDDVDFVLSTGDFYRGVKSNSVLNDLNFFHVCNPGLPPCLAHDLFEGVVQYDLIMILNKLVNDKILCYKEINENYKTIKFSNGYKKINIPELKKCEKLIGTASQNMFLLNIIPFIVFSKIPGLSENKYWEMLLILRQICTLTMSLKISLDSVAILGSLIKKYIQYRTDLFENSPLKPKHHYMLHYVYYFLNFGPLRQLWTLRFESKHSYFKMCVRHLHNFKNVLYSLTKKHQLLQCLNDFQEDWFSEEVTVKDSEIYLDPTDNNRSIKYKSKEIIYRGILYSVGMFVVASKNEYNIFRICKIKDIILDKTLSKIIFRGLELNIAYDNLFGLYLDTSFQKNDLPDNNLVVEYQELLNVEPLIHANIGNQDLFYFKSAPLEFY